MRFAPFTSGFLVFLFFLPPAINGHGTAATRRRAMVFGDVAEINGMSVGIRGELGPASFFQGLHSVEQKDRTVVLNDEGEVQFFPERVTITFLLMGPISKAQENMRSPIFDPQFMEGLRFRVEWKRGLGLRPVKQFTVLTASASLPPDLGPFLADFRECWIYELVVEDSEVPIEFRLPVSTGEVDLEEDDREWRGTRAKTAHRFYDGDLACRDRVDGRDVAVNAIQKGAAVICHKRG